MMKLRNKSLAALTLGTFLLAGTAYAASLPDRVAKAAQERIDAGTNQTIIFGIVDGDKTDVVAFGKLDNGKTPDADTVYEIGSVTKTFTATVLAEEVLAGKVKLETPVTKILPDFKLPERNGKVITMGSLSEQNSGLPRMPGNFKPKDPENPYADYDGEKMKEFLGSYTLTRDPGEKFEYSNLGVGLLGYALAHEEHESYGAMVAKKIFKPLNMTMSSTTFTDQMRAHLAPGHDEAGKPAHNWDLDALAGAGVIRSTVKDMLAYLKANMTGTPGTLGKAMKFAQEPRFDVSPNMRIGLNWLTTKENITWHNGGTGGYRTFLGFTTDGKHGVIIFTNTSTGVDDLGFATLNPSAPIEEMPKEVALSGDALKDFPGSYKLDNGPVTITIAQEGGKLTAQAGKQTPIPLFASGPNEFFAKIGLMRVKFTRDDKGVVTGLVFHQGGDMKATKVSNAAQK